MEWGWQHVNIKLNDGTEIHNLVVTNGSDLHQNPGDKYTAEDIVNIE